MTQQIALRLPEEMVAKLDEFVGRGRYPNRTSAIRGLVQAQLDEEREREIAESYRRGYGDQSQEEWIGEAGLELMAQRVAELESDDRATR